MGKNILIFADGTGNEGGLLPDESRTNVCSLFRATRIGRESPIDPAQQLAFYVPGVGTPIPGKTAWWQRAKEDIQQAYGGGITKKIIDCYVAILGVWRPGDRIYLFGFSRGAYTVRCLAHVLQLVGIPTTEAGGEPLNLEPDELRKVARAALGVVYRWGLPVSVRQEREAAAKEFCEAHNCLVGADIGAVPYFIGVFDTVAALGWAHLWPVTYDQHFPKAVRFARHAMAIDEFRRDFVRVPWGGLGTVTGGKPGEPEPFQQIWFAGNHSDIGGSYPDNESRLSDITLKWMADFIEYELPAEARVHVDRSVLRCSPSSAGMMHDQCMVGMAGTPLHWYPADRDVPTEAILHETVYERLKMKEVRNFIGYGPYRPAPLRNHAKAKVFYKDLSAVAARTSAR
jgi:uncharacterized protein (DUF2235 family)